MIPTDPEAEKALLSIMAGNDRAIDTVAATTQPTDWHDDLAGRMWAVMLAQRTEGKPTDTHALVQPLMADRLPIAECVAILSDPVPPSSMGHYLGRMKDAALRRSIWIAATKALSLAEDTTETGISTLGALQADLSLCERQQGGDIGETLQTLWGGLVERMQGLAPEAQAIGTGIKRIDDVTRGGPRRGQMVLIGALRHVGKTAFARQLALNAGMAGHKVLAFLAESAPEDEAANTMAAMSGVPVDQLCKLEGGASVGTMRAMGRVMAAPIPDVRIDTEAGISAEMIETRCRVLKSTKGLDVILVDYLQFLATKPGKGQTREQVISEDARRLKVLARNLNCVLYLLVQLNDTVDATEEPTMAHIRESKGPVNHADIVWLMSAPDGIEHDPQIPGSGQRRFVWNRKHRGVGAFSRPWSLTLDGPTQRIS